MKTLEKLRKLQQGEMTALDNATQFLKVINEHNTSINALIVVDHSRVKKEASELDKIKDKTKLPLFGLCIAVKASIHVTGYPASCGSNTLKDYIAGYDADVVRFIRNAGAIIIGIANCDEFCCGISGETSAFGPTKNPKAKNRVPGGSSSGSAAAVAAGMSDLALGSDTGGSVRNPASHCGVVGIKPSYGRVSRYGLIDLSMSLDQIGPIAPDVEGAALLLSVISSGSDNDGTMVSEPLPNLFNTNIITNPRIGIIKEMEALCKDKRIWTGMMKKAKEIAEEHQGTVIELSMPLIKAAVQTYYPICYVEFFSGTRKMDGRRFGKKIEESCGEEVLRRIVGGKEISQAEFEGVYYRKALASKKAIQQEMNKLFSECDFILSPVTPELPYKMGEKMTDPRIAYSYDAYTVPASLAGISAGSVPASTIDEVPVGIQTMAPNEEVLVQSMKLLEESP